jgi:hypothetical protein
MVKKFRAKLHFEKHLMNMECLTIFNSGFPFVGKYFGKFAVTEKTPFSHGKYHSSSIQYP